MGRRAKRRLHQELHTLPNVLEYDRVAIALKVSSYAKAYSRVVLEVGCGKGEYTVALAQADPHSLYVGLDYQGERIWRGATSALAHKLSNVLFIRGWADHLLQYLMPHSVNEIWLTFPDPFPKDKQENRRLIAPRFLEIYQQILPPGGTLHLKTDAKALHEYAKATLVAQGWKLKVATNDIDKNTTALPPQVLQVHTYFEDLHRALGEPITYLQATVADTV